MPQTRETYAVHHEMTTRWRDNDVYGHMNNAVFYEYVDTAVNYWLKTSGALDVPEGDVVGLVVASSCEFAASLGFPDPVTAGLGVRKIRRTRPQRLRASPMSMLTGRATGRSRCQMTFVTNWREFYFKLEPIAGSGPMRHITAGQGCADLGNSVGIAA